MTSLSVSDFNFNRSSEMYSPGSTTNLGQGKLHTPDLTLVAETVFADELKLGIPIP